MPKSITRRIILVVSFIYFFSCSNTRSLTHLNKNAIICILDESYNFKKLENIEVYYKQSYLRRFDDIEKESQDPIHFTIDKTSKKSTYFIKSIPSKSASQISLHTGKKKSRDQISTDYWVFSPIFHTDSINYFIIYSERSMIGEIDYSMHLLKKLKNNQFVYKELLGGYAVFY